MSDFFDCSLTVEPGHVDQRWHINSGDRETLAPAWAVPFIVMWEWRRIRKRRAVQSQLAATVKS